MDHRVEFLMFMIMMIKVRINLQAKSEDEQAKNGNLLMNFLTFCHSCSISLIWFSPLSSTLLSSLCFSKGRSVFFITAAA